MPTPTTRTVRIAIITDVHANVPALTAALDAIAALGCDRIVHVGDAIGIGPFPAETLSLLLAQPQIRFVMGNHDAWFAHGVPDPRPSWMSAGERAHHAWTHAALDRHDPALRAAVRRWPWQLDEVVNGVRLRWRHYAPAPGGGTDFAAIVHDPDPATLDRLFLSEPGDAPDILFFGHHHPTMDRVGVSGVRFCNPGALGCGHDAEGTARFAVLAVEPDGRWAVTHHQAPYDLEPVLRALEERAVPDRDLIRQAFFGR